MKLRCGEYLYNNMSVHIVETEGEYYLVTETHDKKRTTLIHFVNEMIDGKSAVLTLKGRNSKRVVTPSPVIHEEANA